MLRVTLGLAAVLSLCVIALAQPETEAHRSVVRAGSLVSTDRGSVVWSPAGDRIAYIEWTHISTESTRRDICVLGLTDLVWRRITDEFPGTDPTWSPDGTQIAYIEDSPETQGSGDIVAVPVDGGEARRLTHGGGFFRPSWIGVRPDRLIAFRREGESAASELQACLVSPGADKPVTVLGRWKAVDGLPRDVLVSPSGQQAFFYGTFKVSTEGPARRALRAGLAELHADGTESTPMLLDPPPASRWIDSPAWSHDEARVVFTIGIEGSAAKEIWLLDAAQRSLSRVLPSSAEGDYDYAEWADGDTALVALYVPTADPANPKAPQMRLASFDGSKPNTIEPGWTDPLPVGLGVELAPDPTGRVFTVCSSGEIRFFELGTKTEAAQVASIDNLRRLADALVEWAETAMWGDDGRGHQRPFLPDPTNKDFQKLFPQVDARSDDFWVDLIAENLKERFGRDWEKLLRAPNDPDPGRRTSYIIPPESYGADIGFGVDRKDVPLLRERPGLNPGGYHVLRLSRSVEWVAE